MEWKEEHDILLCREILVSQPFKFKERTELQSTELLSDFEIPREQAISQRAI